MLASCCQKNSGEMLTMGLAVISWGAASTAELTHESSQGKHKRDSWLSEECYFSSSTFFLMRTNFRMAEGKQRFNEWKWQLPGFYTTTTATTTITTTTIMMMMTIIVIITTIIIL